MMASQVVSHMSRGQVNHYRSLQASNSRHSFGQLVPGGDGPAQRFPLPETLEDLYASKIKTVDRAIALREEKNCGRRMPSWTRDYSWTATRWDWLLEELRFVGIDSWELRKWKKAAAYKLAHDVLTHSRTLCAQWRYRDAAKRAVALMAAASVKQAFAAVHAEYKQSAAVHMTADHSRPPDWRLTSVTKEMIYRTIQAHNYQRDPRETLYRELRARLQTDSGQKPTAADVKAEPQDVHMEGTDPKPGDNGPKVDPHVPASSGPMIPRFDSLNIDLNIGHFLDADLSADSLLAPTPSVVPAPQPRLGGLNPGISEGPDIPLPKYQAVLNDKLELVYKIPQLPEVRLPEVPDFCTPQNDPAEKRILDELSELFFIEAEQPMVDDNQPATAITTATATATAAANASTSANASATMVSVAMASTGPSSNFNMNANPIPITGASGSLDANANAHSNLNLNSSSGGSANAAAGSNSKAAKGTTVSQRLEDEEPMLRLDFNKPLLHTIPSPEDAEFMEYMTYLPECSDPRYQQMYQR